MLQQQKEEVKVEKEPPLEDVLDNVLEGIEKLDIKEEDKKNEPDFNEEEIVEEY